MSDYIAAEYSDIFHQSHVNFDERRELVQVVSKAIARRMDQLCIDALNAASSPSTVATSVGGSASNMNIDKLRAAAKALNDNNVPAEGRHLLMHSSQLDALLGETETTSSDFATVKALVRGEINQFMGFNIITMGDRDEVVFQNHLLVHVLHGTKAQWVMLKAFRKRAKLTTYLKKHLS